ncbi:MAG: phage scaffolding protein [Thomasclavelia sp.]|uniref:phage scaffolding protein n=1 Tax=Thomasclavelia sp. TaxID=3025757 RepID=UPI00399EED59
MKRKDLKRVNNLTKKQMEDIMLLHQLDIIEWKRKMSVKDSQIKKLKEDLGYLKSGINEINIGKLEQELKYWKSKYQKDIKEINFKYTFIEKTNNYNVKDINLLKKLIDMNKISYQNGKLYGLDEQIKLIKQLHPCLFN